MTDETDAIPVQRVFDLQDQILHGSLAKSHDAYAQLVQHGYVMTARFSVSARLMLGTPNTGRDAHSVRV